MINTEVWGAFGSRLGRKVVSLLLLACLLPMFIFAVTLYFQSTWLLRSQAFQDMENYVDMASEQVFTSLKKAEFLLADLDVGDSDEAVRRLEKRDYFSEIYFLDSKGRKELSGTKIDLSGDRLQWLRQGEPSLSSPYEHDGHFTVSVVQPIVGGEYLAGEIKLKQLWKGLRASNFGPRDIAVVTDQNLRVLASSTGRKEFPLEVMPPKIDRRLPEARGTASGRIKLDEIGGEYSWSAKKLWLSGRYHSGSWFVFLFRPQENIDAFSRQILWTLIIFFVVTVLVFVILAERFSRHILAPIIDLHRAASAVEDDEIPPALPLDRDDELGELARVFERVRNRRYSGKDSDQE